MKYKKPIKDRGTMPLIFYKLRKIFGTHRAIAHILGLRSEAVCMWFIKKHVPLKHMMTLIKASNGKLRYEDFENQ